MARSRGTATKIRMLNETSYGVRPTTDFNEVPFISSTLGAEQGLEEDDIIGLGRQPQRPTRGPIEDQGAIVVPLDLRNIGLWLTGLFGAPTTTQVAATGFIQLVNNPSDGDTITINGTVFTFKTLPAGGFEIQIGASNTASASNAATALNASGDANVTPATYAAASDKITVTHDTLGAAGNSFTLAASAATVSGPTLTGGGYQHVFTAGAATLPSYAIEVGHEKIPAYFMNLGCRFGRLELPMQRGGKVNATVNIVAQGEETETTVSQAGTPTTMVIKRFSGFQGSISLDAAPLGNITAGNIFFDNGLDPVETIRSDGKIEEADPGEIAAGGQITARFADLTLKQKARQAVAVQLDFTYKIIEHEQITFTYHQCDLPDPKQEISGPGGIEASFDFQASEDGSGNLLTVTLRNDVASYALV